MVDAHGGDDLKWRARKTRILARSGCFSIRQEVICKDSSGRGSQDQGKCDKGGRAWGRIEHVSCHVTRVTLKQREQVWMIEYHVMCIPFA